MGFTVKISNKNNKLWNKNVAYCNPWFFSQVSTGEGEEKIWLKKNYLIY